MRALGAVALSYLVELTAPRRVGLRTYPDPAPGDGEVLVRTRYSGISAGTELTQYRGTNPQLGKTWDAPRAVFVPGEPSLSYPVDVWGYSEVGVVEAVGAGVDRPAPGEVVW